MANRFGFQFSGEEINQWLKGDCCDKYSRGSESPSEENGTILLQMPSEGTRKMTFACISSIAKPNFKPFSSDWNIPIAAIQGSPIGIFQRARDFFNGRDREFLVRQGACFIAASAVLHAILNFSGKKLRRQNGGWGDKLGIDTQSLFSIRPLRSARRTHLRPVMNQRLTSGLPLH